MSNPSLGEKLTSSVQKDDWGSTIGHIFDKSSLPDFLLDIFKPAKFTGIITMETTQGVVENVVLDDEIQQVTVRSSPTHILDKMLYKLCFKEDKIDG